MVGVYNGCYFVGAIISTWLEYGIVNLDKVSTSNITILQVLTWTYRTRLTGVFPWHYKAYLASSFSSSFGFCQKVLVG